MPSRRLLPFRSQIARVRRLQRHNNHRQKKKKRVYIYIFDLKFIIKTDLSLKSNSEIQLFPNLRVHEKFFIDGVAVLRSRPRTRRGGRYRDIDGARREGGGHAASHIFFNGADAGVYKYYI